MPEFAEVRFKGTRKDYFTCQPGALQPGSWVMVEAERGRDLGRVTALGAIAERKCSTSGGCATPEPSRKILRQALADEIRHVKQLRTDEDRVRALARDKVAAHRLKMKVTEAEWQFDRKKLIIYFTAERRVDFRALVRDLARTFRTRIELRQIGVRDEAAMLGGVGRCGRELCCSTWLPSLRPVSLQLAKDQRLSLNPSQISGCCGRLMCCLKYEHDAYVRARRRFPREGRSVNTSLGRQKVVAVDIWSETVTLMAGDGARRKVTLKELKKEVSGVPRGKGSN
ncbi:MAG: regulatory iron-sulfur-containing complex subunit RicT [Gammaproteobacteria bacterium]|nr:regulatory iron-sulfur-containing complex subunit RicT [Gammaproteobacteria bacterium]MDE0650314.1 regulatory iron-sulfur-containing complex subunit RicT [Gammaproteobacteria bacterium]MXW11142.1 stage 0 sporulation protein [Gammaproteobacteria bacterium]MYC50826.1 stage 0 sporulation protein [Gammaproteobacteria bacterium]